MNHIYKSIFNKALGVFTAVPEFASAHGKGSERTVVGRVAKGTAGFAASALAISIGLALSSNAMANVDTDVASGVLRIADTVMHTNSIRMGTGTTLDEANKKLNSISIGVDAGASATGSTAIGANAKARAEYSVALGDSAVSGDNTVGAVNGGGGAIAIGRQSMANNYNAIAIGMSASVSPAAGVTTASDGIAIGSETVVDNYKGIAVGAYSQAKGRQSTVIANNVQGSNYSTASGTRSQVYGAETNVSGNNSVAIGDTNTVASDRTYVMGNNINAPAGTQNSLAFGTRASVGGASSIAMGLDSKTNTDGSIAMGLYSEAGGPITNGKPGINATAIGTEAKALGLSAVAMGYRATVENGHDSIAIGVAAKSTNKKSTAIGTLSEASGEQSTVISNNYDAKGGQSISIASGRRSQIYGSETTVSGEQSVAIGDTNTVASARTYVMGNNINAAAGTNDSLAFGTKAGVGGANAIALGNTAKATQDNSIAQGTESATYGKNSVSIGYKAISGLTAPTTTQTNAFSVSIGNETEALDASTIAIGDKAKAKGGVDALAVGTQANAMTYKALAIGAYSQATGRQSTVIGNDIQGQPSIASGTRSQILGVQSNVSGDNSVSIGDTNTIASARTYALGNNINVAAGADDSLVFGTQANVGAVHSIAMGTTAAATGIGSIALGKSASATEQRAIAMGENALAGNEASMALGYNSSAKGSKQVSIGLGAGALKNATDAGAELATFVGHYAGADNASPTGNAQGVAVGVNAGRYGVSGIRNVAVGPNTGQKVEGDDNTAMGYNSGRGVKGTNNFAGGANAGVFVEGNNNVALGFNAGIGAEAKPLKVNRTTAVGSDARALADDSVALGDHAIANNANSVAIGTRSATSDIHTGDYTLNGSYTAAGLPVAANGTVSVGSAGKERQIQNVAAGVISATSTDAINGSQLYATNNYMNNLAGDVKTKLGGNAALGNDGHLTMTNIGGTGKDNVNDAIAAANTKVVAGDNITVTPTTNADGSKTYTVKTTKDLVVNSVQAGDTTVNTNGVTIANGPSVTKTGINADNKKITGVADGNVAAGSTDAVNGSQLHTTNAKLERVRDSLKDVMGGNATVTPLGDVTTSDIGGTGKDTVHDAIKAVNDKAKTAVQEIESANPDALSVKKDGTKVTLTPNVIAGDLVNPATGAVNTPAAGDAGKLVTAGTVANALANTHFVVDTAKTDGELDAASKHDQKIKSGNKVTLQAGKNLKAKQTNAADGATVEFSLKDSISLTQVTAGTGANQVVLGNNGVQVGGNTLNSDGLTITGGPSVKKDGINAGNKKITDVADGNVAPGSKEAVNGGQLAEVKAKADSAVQNVVSTNPTALTATKAGDTVTLTPNFIAGDLVNADGTVKDPAAADEGKLVSAKTVADALKANHFVVDTKANGGKTEAGSEADAKVGSSNKVTFEAGKNLTAKQANTANGGATVKFSLQDDISLNSVTAGTGDNQVVLGNDGVKVGGKTYINNDGLNANDKKITNVAPGAVTPTSKDAVNGGQLYDVAKNVADLVGPDAKIDPATGKVSVADPAQGIGGTGKDNIGDAIKAVNATAAKHTTVVEGKNVKVTKGKNAAGGDEYTVATKDDLEVTSVTAGNTTVNTNGLTITGGPSVTRGGIDAGNRIISGVKAGDVSATSQEAVNGSQLHATNTKLDGVKAKADTAVQDVKSGNENALTAEKDPTTNIVTVTPKLSGDLVDANGNITAPTTPADKGKLVTAGTVADALANTHFVVDTKATDGELDAASQADQKIKAGNKVTLQAGKNLKAKQTNGANGAQVEFSLKDSISLKEVTAGEGANQVVLNNKGVNVGGNTYINNDGLNANGNKITKVADGVDPKDAVNKGQLDAVKGVADSAVKSVKAADGEENLVVDNADPKNPKLSLKKDLTADSLTLGDKAGDHAVVNKDGLTIANGPSVKKDGIDAGDKKITNVAAGNVAENSKDAVNGGQLHNVAKGVADVLGGDAAVDGNGKVTMTNIGETGKGNVNDAIKHVNDLAKNAADTAKKHTTVEQGDNIVVEESTNADGGKHYKVSTAKNLNVDSVKAGDTTVNNDGVTINNGPSMTKDGINANNTKVTNVADGVDAADAVNKGQLDKVDTKVSNVAQNVVNVLGGDATVNGNGDITMTNIGETGKGNINDAIKSVNDLAKKAAAEKTSVKAKEGRSNVTVTEGINAAGGHEYTVDVERSVTNAGSDYVTVTNNHDADSNTTTYTVDVSAKTKASLAKADSAVQGLTSKDGNLNFTKGANGNVEVSFNDNLNVKNVTTDRVQVANGPSMTKDGINAAGKAISNVANGNVAADSKDAVNGGQLHETAKSVADVIGGGATVKDGKVVAGQNGIGNTGQNTVHGAIAAINQNTANNFNQIRGDLRKMDRDLRGGIAGALATAGLPQAFRPGKSMVAAAASTYRGQSGLAIGVSRISDNGKVILKVTGNTNSRGDFGGTIGAGYQW